MRPTIHEVAREYHLTSKTQADVGDKYNVGASTIGRWLRNGKMPNTSYTKSELIEHVQALAVDGMMPSKDIINESEGPSQGPYQTHWDSLTDVAHEAGLEPNEYSQKGADERLHDPEWLREEYNKPRSLADMADELDCSNSAVLQALQRYDIDRRLRSQHQTYSEALGEKVASSAEQLFAELMKDHNLLQYLEYQGETLEHDGTIWERDFGNDEVLVECKCKDMHAAMGGTPARQAPVMATRDRPVVLYGKQSDAEALPHDIFIEYGADEVPDQLKELLKAGSR